MRDGSARRRSHEPTAHAPGRPSASRSNAGDDTAASTPSRPRRRRRAASPGRQAAARAARRTPRRRRLRRARRPCVPPARQPVPTAARDRAAPATQLVALRTSSRTATRLGLSRRSLPSKQNSHTIDLATARHRRRRPARTPLSGPRPALKGAHMLNESFSPSAPPRGHRVRELVCAYRPLRDSDGRVVDVPTVALNDPRIAAAVLAPLLAGEPVEVFGVACLSTRHRLLAWHVLSRGTRASTPVSMPDVLRARVSHTGHDRPDRRAQPSERRSHPESGRRAAHAASVRRGRRARHARCSIT